MNYLLLNYLLLNYLQSKREMGHKLSYFFSIWVHFKIREYFCIILKYVEFYIQAPFLDQKKNIPTVKWQKQN